MKAIVATIGILIFISSSSIGVDEKVVFIGKPEIRMTIPSEKKPKELSKKEAERDLCVIVKRGKKYYWKSREYRELKKSISGLYTSFILSNCHPAYVRIQKPLLIDRDDDIYGYDDYAYVEHITWLLASTNYWGNADYIDPTILEYEPELFKNAR